MTFKRIRIFTVPVLLAIFAPQALVGLKLAVLESGKRSQRHRQGRRCALLSETLAKLSLRNFKMQEQSLQKLKLISFPSVYGTIQVVPWHFLHPFLDFASGSAI
jgi:hypothetical protein